MVEISMGLTIKNPKLEAEIRALAEQTGETLTDAIATAVSERRARLKKAGLVGEDDRRAALRKIVESINMPAEYRTSNHDDMYDENGLPK
jgi:antitoxin VapB